MFIDPISKKYYTVFTHGKDSEKLDELRDFLSIYTYLKNDVEPVVKANKGTITATITRTAIGSDGKGVASLNVLVRVPSCPYPIESIQDIGYIENGTLYTLYPYDAVAYFNAQSQIKTAYPIEEDEPFLTGCILDFANPICKDSNFILPLSEINTNGVFTSDDLVETFQHTQEEIEKEDLLDAQKWNHIENGEVPALTFAQVSEMPDLLDVLEVPEDNGEADNLVDVFSSYTAIETQEEPIEVVPAVDSEPETPAEEDILEAEVVEVSEEKPHTVVLSRANKNKKS